VVQDLDKPRLLGAFWGEVTANFCRSIGCVGTIIDGGIRDVDEMGQAGFKALARSLCAGRVHSHPIRWGGEVEVFGRRIVPGQLIQADKHRFLAIPPGDSQGCWRRHAAVLNRDQFHGAGAIGAKPLP
ncbi:MAG TPA: hypothetical protein VNZ26_15475, partial [Vicinamibacterales bacterium]|nr:hypothetical protein [Vicinamibacterales bacterium]